MTHRRTLATTALCVAFALVGAVAYRVGRARADGAPTMDPLTYGGVVDDGGRPMEGTHSVTVRLWDMPSGGTSACTTVSPTTPFAAGRFRVTMDATCTAAVQMNPNLWAEVIVDSTTLPRSRVGAVPYAIEAARAAGASGALATRIATIEANAQPHQIEIGSGRSSSPFCTTPTTSTSFAPLTVMARSTGLYRISVSTTATSGPLGSARIGCPALTFAFQSIVELSSSTPYGAHATLTAIARLESGRSYTFVVETCASVSLSAASPIVAEQLD